MEKLVTLMLEEDFLRDIDTYYKNFGFHSRSDFIRFSINNTMQTFNNEDSVFVEKKYYEYLKHSIKDRIADDIAKSLGITAEGIRKELYDAVFKGVLKRIVENEQNAL